MKRIGIIFYLLFANSRYNSIFPIIIPTKLIIQVTILLQFQWILNSGKRRQVFWDLKNTECWQVHDKLYKKGCPYLRLA